MAWVDKSFADQLIQQNEKIQQQFLNKKDDQQSQSILTMLQKMNNMLSNNQVDQKQAEEFKVVLDSMGSGTGNLDTLEDRLHAVVGEDPRNRRPLGYGPGTGVESRPEAEAAGHTAPGSQPQPPPVPKGPKPSDNRDK